MTKLLELTSAVTYNTKRVACYLPLGEQDHINVLDQVRKTKPGTEEKEVMFQSFLNSGQLMPGSIAALTVPQTKRYLKQIGALWDKTYNIDDYVSVKWEGKVRYLFLIAGHMRLETARSIVTAVTDGSLADAGAFSQTYYAELWFDLTAEEAVRIQITENVRIALDPVDEMFGAQMVWKWKKKQRVRFTYADLKRMFGRSASWVKSCMLIASLPESTQRLAIEPGEEDPHPYAAPRSVLTSVARLVEFRKKRKNAMVETDINREVLRVLSDPKLTPAIYDSHVTQIISHESGDNGQTTMDLIGGADGRANYSSPVRQIIGEGLAKDAIALEQKFGLVLRMFQEGLLGDVASPDVQPIAAEIDPEFLEKYSAGSPVNNMGRLADIWIQLAPLMAKVAQAEGGRGRARIEAALEEAGVSKAVLNELSSKEGQLAAHVTAAE